jgi:cholesterol transport system auxiliary component
MSARKTLLRAAAAALAALALAGCISVLPKAKPAQLYRFGAPPPTEGMARDATPPRVALLKAPASFARAVGGDRILTVSGAQAAYVAQARWMAPAAGLFDEATAQAYDANTGPARLVARGEVASADYVLKLDMRNFEAVYEYGPKAPPVVLVRLRAIVTKTSDRGLAGEQIFESRVKASDNRVGAIVAAFNQASGEVLGKLVSWTNALPAG